MSVQKEIKKEKKTFMINQIWTEWWYWVQYAFKLRTNENLASYSYYECNTGVYKYNIRTV